MKISGFSIIRNGTRYDYPYLESLRSLLPLVDELVINVGIGDDDTLQQIQTFSKTEGQGKVILFESDWQLDNPEKKKGGMILSEQTNLALDRCTGDWCLYLQADEVLHEADLPAIRQSLEKTKNQPQIDGLLFDYLHFYGSFDVVQQTRSAYRREVRAVRKQSGARSIGDAQSFRKANGAKLKVIRCGARIFHYGWVRTPDAMKEKTYFMDQLYHGIPTTENAATGTPHTGDNYRYKRFWGLRRYSGNHPKTMTARIKNKGWHWDLSNSPMIWNWSDSKRIVLDLFEKATGVRLFEYRCYTLVKRD